MKNILNNLPGEINGYNLTITKEDDMWVMCYENDYGYLKNGKNHYEMEKKLTTTEKNYQVKWRLHRLFGRKVLLVTL